MANYRFTERDLTANATLDIRKAECELLNVLDVAATDGGLIGTDKDVAAVRTALASLEANVRTHPESGHTTIWDLRPSYDRELTFTGLQWKVMADSLRHAASLCKYQHQGDNYEQVANRLEAVVSFALPLLPDETVAVGDGWQEIFGAPFSSTATKKVRRK